MIDIKTNTNGEEYLAYNRRRWGSDSWTRSLRRYPLWLLLLAHNMFAIKCWNHISTALIILSYYKPAHFIQCHLFKTTFTGSPTCPLPWICNALFGSGLDPDAIPFLPLLHLWSDFLHRSGAKDGLKFENWQWWPNTLHAHRWLSACCLY
jgi:hypothetical protein